MTESLLTQNAGTALHRAVAETLPVLEALLAHGEPLGAEGVEAIARARDGMQRRLERDAVQIVIAGEKKAGKSTFLNAILGAPVLGTAVRECTGTVTFIRRGPTARYLAHFRDGRLEDFASLMPDMTDTFDAEVEEATAELAAFERDGTFPPAVPPDVAAFADEQAAWEAARQAIEARLTAEQRLGEAIAAVPAALREEAPDAGWWLRASRAVTARLKADQLDALDQGQQALEPARETERQACLAGLRLRVARLESRRLAHRSHREASFAEAVQALTDMDRRGREVTELVLEYPGRFLPEGLTLIDTPGVNTDDADNQARAWQVITEQADGCILLSDLQQAMSQSTRDFLRDLKPILPHVVLVLTKADRARANAEGGETSAEAQLDEARRVGLKRFSKEMGRAPEEIIALTVAAAPALAGDPQGVADFDAAMAHLFEVLDTERTLVLGARAARTLDEGMRLILEAQTRAEGHFADRLARLEAQRIPQPEAFRREQIQQARPVIEQEIMIATEAGVQQFRSSVARLKTRWQMKLMMCVSKDELKEKLPAIAEESADDLAAFLAEAQDAIQTRVDACLNTRVSTMQEDLRTRYRLAQSGAGLAVILQLDFPELAVESDAATVRAGLDEVVTSFESDVFKLRAGGAAAGAALGTLVMPGVGTALGALVGSFAGNVFGVDMLREDCLKQAHQQLDAVGLQVAEQLREDRSQLEAALLERLDGALQTSLERFHAAIAGMIHAEQQALDRTRAQLAELVAIRRRLDEAHAEIQRLSSAAADVSRGLSRP